MRPSLLALLFIIAICSTEVRAVEYREETFLGKRITVCRVDVRKERLQLFLTDQTGHPLKSFANLKGLVEAQGGKLTFAMNAGMFHPGFAPVGLYVAKGKQLYPLNIATGTGNFFLKPNGVFLVSDLGARVVESSEYHGIQENVSLATQSGPLLVHGGQIHPAFTPDSASRLIRNGVGVPDRSTAIFALAEDPISFHEFARFFRDQLHCPDALFLDGTISSLHTPTLKRTDVKIDLGPMVAVTE